MELTKGHKIAIATFIGGLGTQLATAKNGWQDVVTPGFVAGLMITFSSVVIAAMSDKLGGEQ